MINTILVGHQNKQLQSLRAKIEKHCPYLTLKGIVKSIKEMQSLLVPKDPNLVFFDPNVSLSDLDDICNTRLDYEVEKVFISDFIHNNFTSVHSRSLGYISMPIKEHNLIAVVEKARERISKKIEAKKNQLLIKKLLHAKNPKELVGIPTIEGYLFVSISEIIRCEGFQKCTRVITNNKTDIISSYNIGQFMKLLEPYGFFSPHKSHLINLSYIKEYKREGTIILQDGSYVPVSKRRKSDFIKQIVHL